MSRRPCADPENFLGGGGGGLNSQTENFNMAKTNNLAIPAGGGGGWTPYPPSGFAHGGAKVLCGYPRSITIIKTFYHGLLRSDWSVAF